ncbi:transposase [Methylocystis iwaonis]|uniref:transposase n=1 Tax=Methylocystis iwaonis TaxID=2885079 RepID=UPI0033135EB7
MIDSTTAKAHRSAAGGKGGHGTGDRALARGHTTKIHAVVDGEGRPVAFEVTPGQLGDVRCALALLTSLPPARLCTADAAYDQERRSSNHP